MMGVAADADGQGCESVSKVQAPAEPSATSLATVNNETLLDDIDDELALHNPTDGPSMFNEDELLNEDAIEELSPSPQMPWSLDTQESAQVPVAYEVSSGEESVEAPVAFLTVAQGEGGQKVAQEYGEKKKDRRPVGEEIVEETLLGSNFSSTQLIQTLDSKGGAKAENEATNCEEADGLQIDESKEVEKGEELAEEPMDTTERPEKFTACSGHEMEEEDEIVCLEDKKKEEGEDDDIIEVPANPDQPSTSSGVVALRPLKLYPHLVELAKNVVITPDAINGVKSIGFRQIKTAIIVGLLPKFAAGCVSFACMDEREVLRRQNTALRRRLEKTEQDIIEFKRLKNDYERMLENKLVMLEANLKASRDECNKLQVENDAFKKAQVINGTTAPTYSNSVLLNQRVSGVPGVMGTIAPQQRFAVPRANGNMTRVNNAFVPPRINPPALAQPSYLDRTSTTSYSVTGNKIRITMNPFFARDTDPDVDPPLSQRKHYAHPRIYKLCESMSKPQLMCSSDLTDVMISKKMAFTLTYDVSKADGVQLFWYVESAADNDPSYNWELIFDGKTNETGKYSILLTFGKDQSFGYDACSFCAWVKAPDGTGQWADAVKARFVPL